MAGRFAVSRALPYDHHVLAFTTDLLGSPTGLDARADGSRPDRETALTDAGYQRDAATFAGATPHADFSPAPDALWMTDGATSYGDAAASYPANTALPGPRELLEPGCRLYIVGVDPRHRTLDATLVVQVQHLSVAEAHRHIECPNSGIDGRADDLRHAMLDGRLQQDVEPANNVHAIPEESPGLTERIGVHDHVALGCEDGRFDHGEVAFANQEEQPHLTSRSEAAKVEGAAPPRFLHRDEVALWVARQVGQRTSASQRQLRGEGAEVEAPARETREGTQTSIDARG